MTMGMKAQDVSSENNSVLSPTEDIIAEARAGRMVIIVDDEDRENEGDLLIPAERATPEVIAFMAAYGRGLICMPAESAIIDRLALPPMVPENDNTSKYGTAFTVSIGAREGVTTGISAFDRAKTVAVAVDPQSGPDDITSPGHIFPLRARPEGVLERSGHTEAAVDIARLAGYSGAGVICEIMKDDGTMARLSDLAVFSRLHGLKIGSIADLIDYRKRMQ